MTRKDTKGNLLRLGESQKKDGTYQYRWINEKGVIKITRSEDLDSLRKEIAQIHQYLDHGIPTDTMQMTLDNLYRLWLTEKQNLRTRTVQRYTGMYEKSISGALGKKEIRKIRKADVRHYCEDLISQKGLKESTVRNYFRLLYQILEFGVHEGYLPENPARRAWRSGKTKGGELRQKSRRALTAKEQRMILETLDTTPALRRWAPVIRFMMYTGLRVGEVEALRWRDIDKNRKILTVAHTMGRKFEEKRDTEPEGQSNRTSRRNRFRKCLSQPKTESGERQIPLMKDAERALDTERKRQKRRGITCREKVDGCSDFIFLTDDGRLLSASLLNVVIRQICCQVQRRYPEAFAGMERISCHTLRHTFATRMCEAGVQMKVIQDVMGHADISMTMNVYTEATMDQMNVEILALEGKFRSPASGEAEI